MLRTLGSYIGLTSSPTNVTDANHIDIKLEKFDSQNGRHLTFIDERLQNFIARRDAIQSFDIKMLSAMALETFAWFGGAWGMYIAAAGYVATYLTAKYTFGRDQLQKEFDQALDDLFDVYRWYAKDQTPAISHQPKFQEMLEVMIPFVTNSKELMLWDLSRVNQYEMSDRYLEIFAKAPHPVIFVMNKPANQPAKPAQAPQIANLPDPQKWIWESNQYKFFAETKANAKLRLLYGHDLKTEVTEKPRVG
ncbi:MAG TPA: hypothetical protein VL360_04595 [Gammaproteobacteria bacterium]|nr:hypothetical protein [Gammaproteobacteria bacterium]